MNEGEETEWLQAAQRTIELIDVLWFKGNSILAAFEVECTTSIYSGLLRMSDLLSLQPHLDIKLYLAAPDERHDKVKQEIQRPTFSLLRPKPPQKVLRVSVLPHPTPEPPLTAKDLVAAAQANRQGIPYETGKQLLSRPETGGRPSSHPWN
jgi:hypothetical protein